jgi:hypothetical protein
MRTLLACLALGCSAQRVVPIVDRPEPVVVGDGTRYSQAARDYHARELCALELRDSSEVMVVAGNSLVPSEQITRALCERPGVAAAASGTAAKYKVYNYADALLWGGTVGTTGTDMDVPTTTVTEGVTFTISSFTHTVPATTA